MCWKAAALALPWTLPCTTICAPISLCGLSSTGFMCTLGGTRAARACSAWARPISPPSAVTAALFDMFCGLNGRTRRPRRVNARASPATSSDLPTSEPVPCSIRAGLRSFLGKRVPERIGAGIAYRALENDLLGADLLAVVGLVIGIARLDQRAFQSDAGIGALALRPGDDVDIGIGRRRSLGVGADDEHGE